MLQQRLCIVSLKGLINVVALGIFLNVCNNINATKVNILKYVVAINKMRSLEARSFNNWPIIKAKY